ncbi:MAG TPA: glycoside hydrolase family 18 protein [Chitinophagaceae bacterium]|nr:glycoside hydrolase family 18 protein [Chitinophagaceae bacterium]
MKKVIYNIGFLFCVVAIVIPSHFIKSKTKPVIIGYVGGFRGLITTDSIDVWRLSHINYAFVDIKDNRAWLHNEATDTVNLRKLSELKKINPGLKILISIGGWTWSKNFSDAVLTDTSTQNFASSAVAIVSKYNLDGIDIDWEYPGMMGDSNMYRPEDKQHYTLLFKDLRQGLDSLSHITHLKYYVTTAVGGSQDYINHTEMDKVQQYADYINVMSYDYAGGSDPISGHHTNLYVSSADSNQYSAHRSIQAFIAAGVPPAKIVIGIAFYGKGWQMESADNNGLYRKALKPARGGGFTYLKDSLVNKNGYKQYWDAEAKAPYLFNPEKKIFISYDDERSVKEKCKYVKHYHLGGAMFWEYNSDKKEYLLKVIAGKFKYKNENK